MSALPPNAAPPVKPAAPPPPTLSRPGPAPAAATPKKVYGVQSGRQAGGQRVLLYGPPGVGKSELASLAPGSVFLDLEGGTRNIDCQRVVGLDGFADVRAWLQSSESDPFSTVWIDTGTKLEEMAQAFILATVPGDKPGMKMTGLESYSFGKGYRHLYDAMSLALFDADRLVRAGKNVGVIAHCCTSEAPNPFGDNWLRYEPRLQHPKKESSVRERVFGWADHAIFIGYDVAAERGKGVGAGTRTLYTCEMPTHMAKTRGAFDPTKEVPPSMPYPKGDGSIWSLILKGAA